MDATADILLYGNAERAVVEIAQRLAQGEPLSAITDVRGTAFVRRDTPEGWFEIDSTRIDRPGKIDKIINPYVNTRTLPPAPSSRKRACRRTRRKPRSCSCWRTPG